MLPKKLKLKLRAEPDFFQNAERYFAKSFTVFYKKNPEGKLRLAVVVPKKVSLKAVERNRMKRLVSAAVAGAAQPHLSAPYSLVFVAKAAAKKTEARRLSEEINQAFEKIIEQNDRPPA